MSNSNVDEASRGRLQGGGGHARIWRRGVGGVRGGSGQRAPWGQGKQVGTVTKAGARSRAAW